MTSAPRSTTRRAAVLLAALLTSLIGVASAHATVTESQVTSPEAGFTFGDNTLDPEDPANLRAVTGTTDGTTGDQVAILCQAAGRLSQLTPSLDVGDDGRFSGTLHLTEFEDELCTLRAVPADTFPNDLSPYSGPLIGNGRRDIQDDEQGPNNYEAYQPQAGARSGFFAIGSCGLCDSSLYGATAATAGRPPPGSSTTPIRAEPSATNTSRSTASGRTAPTPPGTGTSKRSIVTSSRSPTRSIP
jgi:hypothetical protein